MVLRGRTSRTGAAIICCCFASAVWAAATAASPVVPTAILATLDSVRLSAWLLFAVWLVTAGTGNSSEIGRRYLAAAALFCGIAVAVDVFVLAVGFGVWDLYVAGAGPHWVRRPGSADDRKPMAQHRPAASLARLAGLPGPGPALCLRAVFCFRTPLSPAAGSIPAWRSGARLPRCSWCRCWRWRWRATANGGSTSMFPERSCCIPRPCSPVAAFCWPSPSSPCCCAGSVTIGGSFCSWRCCWGASSFWSRCSLREASGSASNF